MRRVSLFLILFVALLLIGCASQQYVPKEDEEIYGTWINSDNHPRAKIVLTPEGKWMIHARVGIKDPQETGTFTIVDRWTDSSGTIFYKVIFNAFSSKNFKLIKINNSSRYWARFSRSF